MSSKNSSSYDTNGKFSYEVQIFDEIDCSNFNLVADDNGLVVVEPPKEAVEFSINIDVKTIEFSADEPPRVETTPADAGSVSQALTSSCAIDQLDNDVEIIDYTKNISRSRTSSQAVVELQDNRNQIGW